MVERRSADRYRVWLPVAIPALREGLAVTHDASKRGMLVVTASTLDVGAPVRLSFKMPPDDPNEHELTGRVVRVEPNSADPDGLWPHRLAVEFDHPVPELESLLQLMESPATLRRVTRSSRPPPG
jgi:hypothetical protein